MSKVMMLRPDEGAARVAYVLGNIRGYCDADRRVADRVRADAADRVSIRVWADEYEQLAEFDTAVA